ncbi:hypothetical protein NMY22_g10956 [Coprinellus aureogranulatus]|nr:hypothetical protein NMY22_g10956 [Coprinellus aureogranulatus]
MYTVRVLAFRSFAVFPSWLGDTHPCPQDTPRVEERPPSSLIPLIAFRWFSLQLTILQLTEHLQDPL